MDAQVLNVVVAAVLAILFAYVPGFASWYQALGERPDGTNDNGTTKRLVMLALLVATSVVAFGLGCAGIGAQLGVNVTCDQQGGVSLITALVSAIIANQSMFAILPKTGLNATPHKAG